MGEGGRNRSLVNTELVLKLSFCYKKSHED